MKNLENIRTLSDIIIDNDNIVLYNINNYNNISRSIGINQDGTSIKWVLIGNFSYYTLDKIGEYIKSTGWDEGEEIIKCSSLSEVIDISSGSLTRHIYVFEYYGYKSEHFNNYKPTPTVMLYFDFSKWLLKELIFATSHREKEAV